MKLGTWFEQLDPQVYEIRKTTLEQLNGWLPIEIILISSNRYNRTELEQWCATNCNGKFKILSLIVSDAAYFELEDDAMKFKLIYG
jgi:hypothetical protein